MFSQQQQQQQQQQQEQQQQQQQQQLAPVAVPDMHLSRFSDEVLLLILQHLSLADLCHLGAVDRRFHRLTGDRILWRRISKQLVESHNGVDACRGWLELLVRSGNHVATQLFLEAWRARVFALQQQQQQQSAALESYRQFLAQAIRAAALSRCIHMLTVLLQPRDVSIDALASTLHACFALPDDRDTQAVVQLIAGSAEGRQAVLHPSWGPDGGSALHAAAASGKAGLLRIILCIAGGPNTVDRNGSTPLHLAAREGCTEAARVLLQSQASPNVRRSCDGVTPLHWAAQNGHADVVALLLRCGADPNLRNRIGNTPLFRALSNNMWDAALALIDHPGTDITSRDVYRNAPLHVAAAGCGSLVVVQRLLQRGVDVHCEGADGRTAMHFAAARGDTQLLQLLLAHGARVNTRDAITGATPLHWALRAGCGDAAALLLTAGADLGICDTRGVSGQCLLRNVCGAAQGASALLRTEAPPRDVFFAG